jgi:hypothetical protein
VQICRDAAFTLDPRGTLPQPLKRSEFQALEIVPDGLAKALEFESLIPWFTNRDLRTGFVAHSCWTYTE